MMSRGAWTAVSRTVGVGIVLLALVGFVAFGQASDVTAQQVGHINNGSGQVESDIAAIDFGGDLLTRSRADQITPGTSEAVAIVAAICDGGRLNTTSATLLPPSASAPPSVAGGIGSIGCTTSAGTDGLATGINGAQLVFSGPLARYMGTVRMYADVDLDGTLFEAGELVRSNTPNFNASSNQALVSMGSQGQMLSAAGAPLAALDPTTGPPATPPFGPLLIAFTVDIDSGAPSGTVDVALGLGVGDDTAQGAGGICATALAPTPINPPGQQNCGSNLIGGGPERDSFDVVGDQGGGTTPPGNGGGDIAQTLQQYDNNANDRIDDDEFLTMINDWVDRRLSDEAFFAAIDIWTQQKPISSAAIGDARGPNGATRVQTRLTSHGVSFSAPQASSLSVNVYSLDGQTVFSHETSGSTLSWNLRSRNGAPVANGVYLYRATVTTVEGRSVSSGVRKLVVHR